MNPSLVASISAAEPAVPHRSPVDALVAGYAVNRSNLTYLWGPPGSGKSHYLRYFLDYLYTQGTTVLVSSVRDLGLTDQNWAEHVLKIQAQPLDLPWDAALVSRAQLEPFCWIIDDSTSCEDSAKPSFGPSSSCSAMVVESC